MKIKKVNPVTNTHLLRGEIFAGIKSLSNKDTLEKHVILSREGQQMISYVLQ